MDVVRYPIAAFVVIQLRQTNGMIAMAIARPQDPVLVIQYRVMRALILRDIRTRFLGNGLGYILAILWPLSHMVGLLVVFHFAGRVAPYGDSLFMFFATAFIPALGFRYTSRFIVTSVNQNKPLVSYPLVKYMDIILARCVLEAAAACCVAALLMTILFFMGEHVMPEDPVGAAQAFLSTLLLGVGVGSFFGVIAIKVPAVMLPVALLQIPIYITSGIIFIPAALPEQILDIVGWNPVLHSVEWLRESYFPEYISPVLDKEYLVLTGVGFLFLSLLMERGLRLFLIRN